MKWILGIIITVFVAGAISVIGFIALVISETKPAVLDEPSIYSGVNSLKGSTLTYNEILETASQKRAEQLCEGEITHDNFIPELKASQYPYRHAGENIAWGYKASADVVEGWKNSPTHYENIMNPNYTETGIGIAKCNTKTIIVQWFGTK